jgi:hypothetical protein
MTTTQAEVRRPEVSERVADEHADRLAELQRELGGLGVYSRLMEYHRLILQMGEFSPSTRGEPELLVFWPEESQGAVSLRVEVSDVSGPTLFTWHGGLYRADNPAGAAEVICRAVEA